MDFGIICLASVASRKDVAFAEASGFTHAWIADSQMVWADVFQCLALAANDTSTIKLGTNVTNPSSRIAPGVNQVAIAGDRTVIAEFKTHVIQQLT